MLRTLIDAVEIFPASEERGGETGELLPIYQSVACYGVLIQILGPSYLFEPKLAVRRIWDPSARPA